ncbi:MAG: GNAT family N-acetyltransferase [Chloroflexi bacterium]|nr:MAG: GNAT family N-acetyltransferase [Chloroflexota bacterium]
MVGPIDISIRRATPADKRAVNEICRHIWRGNDYVPEVFDEWVRDRRGGLWLATIHRRPIGVAKLTLLGDHEAWLHGLRVHPRFRRRGAARALIAHRVARAKKLGARVARLDTTDDNYPIHRLMRALGFRRAGRFTAFGANARVGEAPERAQARDLPRLWRLARHSGSLLNEMFVQRRISRADLERDVRAGRCLVDNADAPGALAIVQPYEDVLRTRHLAGSGRALRQLLCALRAEAKRRGKRSIRMSAPSSRWPDLRAAGYRPVWSDSMFLFEKRL